jgi:hypothetical protein
LDFLGFPWILSSESSLFNGLRGNFGVNFFVVVWRRRGRLAVGRLEIVDEAVDLVEQALPFLRPILIFRHDRLLVLVEPIDHLDERADRLELATPDRLADKTQGGHQAFELQMRVVGAAVDDPLAEDFRDDLANPLSADPLVGGDLVIRPAFSEPREKSAFSARPCPER